MNTDKEPTYVLEYMTNAGKFYKEFTRAEAIEYIKSQPDFVTRQVENILDICEKARKHKGRHRGMYLRYDIDIIYDDASRLLQILNLLKDEN